MMFKSLSLALALCATQVLGQGGNLIGDLMNSLINPGYGLTSAGPNDAPTFQVQAEARTKSQYSDSKTIKIRYGPYKVPSAKVPNLTGHSGTLWNYPHQYVKKPCEGDCVILGMSAGLEYPDGKNANIDTGLWLHHMVLFTEGNGRIDETCGDNGLSLPHFLIGSTSKYSERTFSSGNERTPAVMPTWGETGVGYKLRPIDKFDLIVDLMNETADDKVVYLTLTFDILDGKRDDFDDMRPVWFDVAQCLTSDAFPPRQKGYFTMSAPPWTPSFEGRALGAAGHLHDGGLAVTLWKDGELACNSSATYGGPGYVNGPDNMEMHANSATEHISKMTICASDDTLKFKDIKPGQSWILKASYNYDKHKGALNHDGKQDTIMGISIMYVRVKSNIWPSSHKVGTDIVLPAANGTATR